MADLLLALILVASVIGAITDGANHVGCRLALAVISAAERINERNTHA